MGLLYAYILFILFTAILALIKKRKFGQPPYAYFPYYLLFMFLVELGGFLIAKNGSLNRWWYNIMINVEIFYLIYLYYSIIKNSRIKNIVLALTGVYVVYFLVNFLALSLSFNASQALPFAFGQLIIIGAIFWYLIEFFKSDEVLKIFDYLIIWTSIGLLVFLVVSLPVTITKHFLLLDFDANDKGLMQLMIYIGLITNFIMYIIFINGILWTSKSLK